MAEKPLLTYLPWLFVLFLWVLLGACLSVSAPPPHSWRDLLLLGGFPKGCLPLAARPSPPSAPTPQHTIEVLALLSRSETLSSGIFKSRVLLRSGLLWGGAELRLEGMSPRMGLGASPKQGSAFAL